MMGRVAQAILSGVIAFILALIVLAIVSAILPGVNISVMFWAGIIGLLVGILAFFGRGPGV